MKIGIVVSTDDAETCWNALRFANFSLKQGEQVKVFFIGRGVDYQRGSTAKFDATGQGEEFLRAGGALFACGTCLKSRSRGGSDLCPISTMKDLYEIVKESDRVVSF